MVGMSQIPLGVMAATDAVLPSEGVEVEEHGREEEEVGGKEGEVEKAECDCWDAALGPKKDAEASTFEEEWAPSTGSVGG